MLQVSVEDTVVSPGEVHEWHLIALPENGLAAAQRTTGYNQAKHFTVAQLAQSVKDPIRSYVAGTFEISGKVDLDGLEAALLHLVRRHAVLRAIYQPFAGDLSCEVLDPGGVTLKHVEVGPLTTSADVRRYLHETFRKVDTLSWPLIVMGAVVRKDSATVYFSCDHLVTDGLSTAIAVNDISSAYLALSCGRPLDFPETGSYLDFSRGQRRDNRATSVDDERLDYWRDFTARNGGLFPRFPLDLGVEPLRLYEPVAQTERLLTTSQTDTAEARCRAWDSRLSMGLLAALAIALREEGGPEIYRGLVPVNERGKGLYAQAMGWFINTLPIEFPVARKMGFTEVLAAVHEAYAQMQAHTDVHFVNAWRLLAPIEYAKIHYWPHAVNFFSYIDFRRVPGGEYHVAWNARMHVWVSRCNGILFWLHRTDEGLYLNSIYVDTPQARRTKTSLVRTFIQTLTDLPG